MPRKSKSKRIAGFFIKLLVILAVFTSISFGGYLILDKAVIPSYFGKYGINDMGDLVRMVRVMHNAPDEKTFITNPYTKENETSALSKLEAAGVPIYNGEIEFSKIADGEYDITEEAQQGIFISDKEMTAIIAQMFRSDYLLSVEFFKNLEYFDTISIEAKEIIVDFEDNDVEVDGAFTFSKKAHVSFTIKIDTKTAQTIMAKRMDVPYFLLDLIMPDFLYMTTSYDIEVLEDEGYRITNAAIGVNGRTPKQSKILLNMLLTFIFPQDDNMTISKLGETFAVSLNDGMNILGDIKFCQAKIGGKTQNGIMVSVKPDID